MSFNHGIKKATSTTGIRPVNIPDTSVICIVGTAPDADANVFPANTPVLVAGSVAVAAKLDTSAEGTKLGSLPNAVDAVFAQQRCNLVVIRVEEGEDDEETEANVIGDVDASEVRTGVHAILNAQVETGLRPRILIAPGFTDSQDVLTELLTIADQVRAVVFADCDGATTAAAITYRDNFANNRLEMCWPALVNTAGATVPLSAFRAGIEAQKDAIPGQEYSASGSNRLISGTVGALYPVDYQSGSTDCLAHVLNSNQITTCIQDGGYRIWGNLSCAEDTKWQFMAHVRTNDVILDAIAESLKWARDRKLNKTFAEDVVETVNVFLQGEVKSDNLLGGIAWADPELNTPEAIVAGEFYIDYDFTPPGVAQSITVTSHFVNDYAAAIFQ